MQLQTVPTLTVRSLRVGWTCLATHFQINMEPRYATMTVDWSAMHCLRHRQRGRGLPSQGWTRSLQMDLTRLFSERTRTVQRASPPGLDIPCMSSACHCAHREVLRNRLNCVGRERSAFGGALHLETQVSPLKNEMQSRAQTRVPFRSCSVASSSHFRGVTTCLCPTSRP